jgi:hypothetical protein
MDCVCVVELHITVNYTKLLSVVHQCFIENFVTSNNKMCVGLHVKCLILHWNKKYSFAKHLYTCNLPKPTVMSEKTLSSFSVSVSIAINHLTNQVELINYEA